MTQAIAPVDLHILEQVFSNLERRGVAYGYGVKIPFDWDSTDKRITSVDCSGWTRWALYKATGGKLIVPDGSQAQREWAEQNLGAAHNYKDLNQADPSRLFWCFIKPNTNGCGAIGHTFFCNRLTGHDFSSTLESHGGKGIDSRRWDYRTLWHEVYNCFELPTSGSLT